MKLLLSILTLHFFCSSYMFAEAVTHNMTAMKAINDYYKNGCLRIHEDLSITLSINNVIFEFDPDFNPKDVVEKCPPIVSIRYAKMSSIEKQIKDNNALYDKYKALINSFSKENIVINTLSIERSSFINDFNVSPFLPTLSVSVISSTLPGGYSASSNTYAYVEELASEDFSKNLSYVLAKNIVEFKLGNGGVFVSPEIMNNVKIRHEYTLDALNFNTPISRKTLCIRLEKSNNNKAMVREVPISLEKIPLFIEEEVLQKESSSEKEESISLEDLFSFVEKKTSENQYNIIIAVSGDGKDVDPNKETIDKLKTLATQKKTLFLNIPNTAK